MGGRKGFCVARVYELFLYLVLECYGWHVYFDCKTNYVLYIPLLSDITLHFAESE